MPLPIVAIIGRPNVGKSTLFNRLMKTHQAIVDDTPGITRDRLYRQCYWNGVDFMLVDTGGLLVGDDDPLGVMVTEQAKIAMDQADTIIFLLDSKTGLQEEDIIIARDLKRSGKDVIIVPNKVDAENDESSAAEFYSLGFKSLVPVSASTGRNIGDLLDAIVHGLPKSDGEEYKEDIKVAVVGRPNVGKSSLVNSMTGQNITIVSSIPGTTRDAIDTRYEIDGRKYLLIDTAGLRKKNIYEDQIEFYTSLRTLRAIARCDICVLLIDATEGLVAGDLRVATEAADLFKGIIFAVNKWDTVESKDSDIGDVWRQAILEKAPLFTFVPIIFISAMTGQRVPKVWEIIHQVSLERKKRIPTAELNQFLEEIVEQHPPPAKGGRHIKIFYMTQSQGDPPTFIFFSNNPKFIDKPYIRYIENKIRDKYGFVGAPLNLIFKHRS